MDAFQVSTKLGEFIKFLFRGEEQKSLDLKKTVLD